MPTYNNHQILKGVKIVMFWYQILILIYNGNLSFCYLKNITGSSSSYNYVQIGFKETNVFNIGAILHFPGSVKWGIGAPTYKRLVTLALRMCNCSVNRLEPCH